MFFSVTSLEWCFSVYFMRKTLSLSIGVRIIKSSHECDSIVMVVMEVAMLTGAAFVDMSAAYD